MLKPHGFSLAWCHHIKAPLFFLFLLFLLFLSCWERESWDLVSFIKSRHLRDNTQISRLKHPAHCPFPHNSTATVAMFIWYDPTHWPLLTEPGGDTWSKLCCLEAHPWSLEIEADREVSLSLSPELKHEALEFWGLSFPAIGLHKRRQAYKKAKEKMWFQILGLFFHRLSSHMMFLKFCEMPLGPYDVSLCCI